MFPFGANSITRYIFYFYWRTSHNFIMCGWFRPKWIYISLSSKLSYGYVKLLSTQI